MSQNGQTEEEAPTERDISLLDFFTLVDPEDVEEEEDLFPVLAHLQSGRRKTINDALNQLYEGPPVDLYEGPPIGEVPIGVPEETSPEPE